MVVLIELCFLSLSLILPLLIVVAFFTLLERKIIASIQRRCGPNVVGFFGMLQPFADGLKLIVKETIIPSAASRFLFIGAPAYIFFLSLLPWAVIPFSRTAVFFDLNLGLLFVLVISSLNVYGIILAGWASSSRYAFLGAVRSALQVISYELSFSIIIVVIGLLVGSYNLINIVFVQKGVWFVFPLLPLFLIFLLIILVETNRTPGDLPESESELVAGYIVDYSAIGFAMVFLGEYSNMLVMSALTVLLFLGGWLSIIAVMEEFIFSCKVGVIALYFIWVRATVPRFRYDVLIFLCWKKLLPFCVGFFIFTLSLLFLIGGLPICGNSIY